MKLTAISQIKKILILLLFVMTGLIFLFALFSGSQSGWKGIIQNIPNALPWLILFAFNVVAIYSEILGGSLIVIFSLSLIPFFSVFANNNWGAFFLFLLPLFLLGAAFIILGILRKRIKPVS